MLPQYELADFEPFQRSEAPPKIVEPPPTPKPEVSEPEDEFATFAVGVA